MKKTHARKSFFNSFFDAKYTKDSKKLNLVESIKILFIQIFSFRGLFAKRRANQFLLGHSLVGLFFLTLFWWLE